MSTTPVPPLNLAIISDWNTLETLAPEWVELLQNSRADCIFLTPEWILSWRQAMAGLDITPHVVALRDDAGELIGLGLYYLRTERLFSLVPYRVLRAMGDFASGAVYHDIIARRGLERVVNTQVMHHLAGCGADAVWIPHVATANGATDGLRQAAHEAGLHVEERRSEFFTISLPATFEDYEKNLSSATRKDLRRATRKLLLEDGSNLRTCGAEQDRAQMLESLIAMNTKRWSATESGGVFRRKPREATFYRTFTPLALERGWLRFMELDVDGTPAAMEIGYRYGDRYYALQGSYDIDGPPGTGKVLLMQMLRRCIAEGVQIFDLLSGDFSYKQRYGAEIADVREFFLVRKSLKTLPLRWLHFWPRGRFLRFYRSVDQSTPAKAPHAKRSTAAEKTVAAARCRQIEPVGKPG